MSEAESNLEKSLVIALLQGDIKTSEEFLKSGATLADGEWNDYLPALYSLALYYDVYGNRKKMLTLLLKHGLDISIKNPKS